MYRRQTFKAPGTWNNPGKVTQVFVRVLGGGGGGGVGNPTSIPAGPNAPGGHGGAGGYIENETTIPVAPVPITVGAGGTGGNKPGPDTAPFPGTIGGTSSFGPPSAPWAIIVDGGGAGGNPTTINAPPIGGGGGTSIVSPTNPFPGDGTGAYGFPGIGNSLDPLSPLTSGGSTHRWFGPSADAHWWFHAYDMGRSFVNQWSLGGGGNTGANGGGMAWPLPNTGPAPYPQGVATFTMTPNVSYSMPEADACTYFRNGKANTGGGGAGHTAPTGTTAGQAGSGGSGLVVVEWDE